jgi:preprotein translocase subunit YajC
MKYLFVILSASAPQEGGDSIIPTLLMITAMMVVMYLFFIRPQQKKQKEMVNFRQNLKKGDRVVTIGGAHGKISEIATTTIDLEMMDGSRIRFDKTAISHLVANEDKTKVTTIETVVK